MLEVGLIEEVDAAGETVLRLWCTCLHSCHQAHTKAQEGTKREATGILHVTFRTN